MELFESFFRSKRLNRIFRDEFLTKDRSMSVGICFDKIKYTDYPHLLFTNVLNLNVFVWDWLSPDTRLNSKLIDEWIRFIIKNKDIGKKPEVFDIVNAVLITEQTNLSNYSNPKRHELNKNLNIYLGVAMGWVFRKLSMGWAGKRLKFLDKIKNLTKIFF